MSSVDTQMTNGQYSMCFNIPVIIHFDTVAPLSIYNISVGALRLPDSICSDQFLRRVGLCPVLRFVLPTRLSPARSYFLRVQPFYQLCDYCSLNCSALKVVSLFYRMSTSIHGIRFNKLLFSLFYVY